MQLGYFERANAARSDDWKIISNGRVTVRQKVIRDGGIQKLAVGAVFPVCGLPNVPPVCFIRAATKEPKRVSESVKYRFVRNTVCA
jgi:hypothetical protein